MLLASKTFNAKCKFQETINQKPLPQDLIQPFLYIEKVIKKRKVDQNYFQKQNNKKGKNKIDTKTARPFVTSSHPNQSTSIKPVSIPHGY
jgi:uncharacterized membrane protein YcaP (DUF421 family)